MGNSSEFERALPRLADQLAEVGAQLAQLSVEMRNLAAITAAQKPKPEPEPKPGPEPAVGPAPEPAPEPEPVFGVERVPPRAEPAALPPWMNEPTPQQREWQPGPTLTERLSREGAGSKVLVWIGGAVTLIGVVLMLILAIQRGWIGPVPRVTLGAVLATGLVGVSLVAHRTPAGRTGAFALAATGIAALYLDIVAATTLLELLPPWLGLGLGLVVALAGLVLAARWAAELLALFVLVACVLCAPLVTQDVNALLLGFLLVLHVAATPVQLMRGWVWVPLMTGVPPLVVALSAMQDLIKDGQQLEAAALSLVASLLVAAIAILTAARRPDDDMPLFVLGFAGLPTLAVALQVPVNQATGALALLGVPMVATWAVARFARDERAGLPPRLGVVAGGVAAVCLFEAVTLQLDGDGRPIGVLGCALVLCLVAYAMRGRGVLLAAFVFASVGSVMVMVQVASILRILLPPEGTPTQRELAVSGLAYGLLATVALALLLVHLRLNVAVENPVDDGVLGFMSGLVVLYGACGLTLCLALMISPDRTGFLGGHSVVTVSWMVAALVLLQRGITRRGPRIAGLVLVGAALFKLVLFDLAALDGLARAAAFLGAGLVLLAASVRYTRLVNRSRV